MSASSYELLEDLALGQTAAQGTRKPHQQHHVYFANPQRDRKHVSDYTHLFLIHIAERANVPSLLINSTVRDASEQAVDMFNNLKRPMHYAAAGRSVLAVARADVKAGKSRSETIQDMISRINSVGLSHVTKHAYTLGLNTVDLSITHFGKFEDAPWRTRALSML